MVVPMTVWESVIHFEPAFVAHITSVFLTSLLVQGLIMEKACSVNLKYSSKICSYLMQTHIDEEYDKYPDEREELQKLVGEILMFKTIIQNAFPILLVFLIGPWSDKHGQKIPILTVIFAFVIYNVLLAVFSSSINTTGAWTIALSTSIVVSISGGQPCFMMAAYSYIIGSVKVEKITTRIGVTEASFFLGLLMGFSGGSLLSSYGITLPKIFIIGLSLELFAFTFLGIMLKNRILDKQQQQKSNFQIFLELFDISTLKESVSSIFRQRHGNIRKRIWIMLLAHACAMGSMYGESTIVYLFYRNKLNWNEKTIGDYFSYKILIGLFSNIFSTILLNYNLPDPLIGIISSISAMVESLIYTNASPSSRHLMFIAPIVGIFASPLYAIPRSTISKLVASTEIGKANAFMGSFECMIPIIISPIYYHIYTKSQDGSFFLVSAGFMIPSLLIYCWLSRQEEVHVD